MPFKFFDNNNVAKSTSYLRGENMKGCVYKTASGQCQKNFDKHRNTLAWCCGDNIICKDRKLSNADKIRAMTDEELAEYLSETCADVWNMFVDPKQMWLEWLKQEVKE